MEVLKSKSVKHIQLIDLKNEKKWIKANTTTTILMKMLT